MPTFNLDDSNGLGALTAAVNQFGFDTGSARSVVDRNHGYCTGRLLGKPLPKPLKYGDSIVDGNYVKTPDKLFGVTHMPICGEGLPQQEGAGRIGLSPHNDPSSIVQSLGYGNRRVVLNRRTGTLCLGNDCHKSALPSKHAKKLSLHAPPQGTVDGRITVPPRETGSVWHMYDTGATDTQSFHVGGTPFCIVGYNDITYLDADFDNNKLTVEANTDACQDTSWGGNSRFLS